MATYKVKFMSGALQGEWMRHKTYSEVVRLYKSLAQLTGQQVSELYKDSFIWDERNGNWGAFAFKGWSGNKFNAVLYIVREYDE